jgi:hypothetical protein
VITLVLILICLKIISCFVISIYANNDSSSSRSSSAAAAIVVVVVVVLVLVAAVVVVTESEARVGEIRTHKNITLIWK